MTAPDKNSDRWIIMEGQLIPEKDWSRVFTSPEPHEEPHKHSIVLAVFLAIAMLCYWLV